jgi:hypothetical protein
MSAHKCSFVPLASLAILFLISVASASAMAQDYAQQINPRALEPKLEPPSVCSIKECVEQYPSSAGTLSGRCKRYTTKTAPCNGTGNRF